MNIHAWLVWVNLDVIKCIWHSKKKEDVMIDLSLIRIKKHEISIWLVLVTKIYQFYDSKIHWSVHSAVQERYNKHTVYFWREILIKKHPFKCTSIWTSIIKRLWRGKKMFKVTLKLQRYFVIYIRSPLKMQKIIKQTSPSR